VSRSIIVLLIAILASCGHPHFDEPHILIETRLGDIEVELYQSKAPKTVAAFLSAIKNDTYTKSSFYRVLKAEELPSDYNTGIIQGGIWKSASQRSTKIPGIQHESTKQTGLSHTDGIISMARTDTGTAKTEFFICIGDQSSLDFGNSGTADGQGYAAFGKVFKGMAIVKKIQSQKSHGDAFDESIEIRKISIQ